MRQRRVSLVMERQVGYRERVLRGVWRYTTAAGPWVIRGMDLRIEAVPAIREFDPHGIIAGFWSPDAAREVVALGRPTVDVFDWLPELRAARVGIADRAVGRMAAAHLLERGLRSFAFVGGGARFAEERNAGFCEVLGAEGYACAAFTDVYSDIWVHGSWITRSDHLRRFLAPLPKPLGVLAANDHLGAATLETCRAAGIRVPEQVAVIGVDNDEFMCNLATPPLSSVAVDAERVGYEAAALLDKLMEGEPRPKKPILIPPVGVVARPSTDLLALGDEDVAAALRLIRARALRQLSVADVLREVPMRRRTFERRFKQAVGHGAAEEIRRVRVAQARHLLAETDLPMPQVATRSGFSNAQRFSRVFHQATGVTPTQYRRQFGYRA